MGTLPHPPDLAELDEALTGHSAEAPDAPPLPVVVVDPVRTEPAPSRTFSTGTMPLTSIPARVVNDVPTRVRLVLTAVGGPVTVARSQGACGPSAGYVLPANAQLVLTAAGELWAADPTNAGTVSLSYLQETTDGGVR